MEKAIKASAAKYVVMVAKHHNGFALWRTAETEYSIQQSSWKDGKGDMVREVAQMAHANGLKFGNLPVNVGPARAEVYGCRSLRCVV